LISTARSNVSNNGADEDKLSCFLQQTYSGTATVCVLFLLLLLLLLLSRKEKKITLWQSPGAWTKKIIPVFYNILKVDELKYNAIASLF
jgi:ascorbate-specific PTS system EIIC-type component UlaA